MEEINFNETPAEEVVESEKALKCDSNEPKKAKTPAMFKAGIALMCATSALSLGAIGACGFLGYKLYKNQKNQDSEPENSMGTVVTNKGDAISVSEDGYLVLNGEKTNIKAEAVDGQDGQDGEDGVSVVNASIVNLDKWGITTQIMFKMSDNSYITTAPQTQIMSEHFYEAEDMSDILTLTEGYGIKKIKLKNDINLSSSIEFDGEAIIDLNRNTLNYTAANPLKVADESSLTIKNGSLYLLTNTGIAVEGEDAELSFNKVNVSATAVVAETLEDNASIKLENSTVETIQQGRRYSAGNSASVGSLFVVKGEHSNIVVSGSNFTTNRAIFAASDNAAEIKLVVKESKINTTAAMLDIDTDVVVPTLDLDQSSIATIETLNTSPITSGSFNFDPTQAGAELEGVEKFNVNGQNVLATDFVNLVEIVEEGSTINLTKNIDLETTLDIDKKLTINLGNYQLTARANQTGRGVLNVVAGGDLTLNADEEGGIDGSCSGYWHIAVRVSGGKATINGGMYSHYAATNPDDPTDDEFDLLYVSGGELIVNGGMFEACNPKWTINIKDSEKDNSKITVNGGMFSNYNPAESHTENPIANFVGENKLVAGIEFKNLPFFGGYEEPGYEPEIPEGSMYVVIPANKLAECLTTGYKLSIYDQEFPVPVNYIYLNGDVTLTEGVVVRSEITLDLGDSTISTPAITELAAIEVNLGGRLTINATENGGINSASQNNDCSIAVWARAGGYAVINGGTYTNVGAISADPTTGAPYNNEMIYTSGDGSEIVINGGKFIGNYENKTWETRYTVNKHDSTNSTITVNGGSFYKYNPAESLSENPIANFVSTGHFVVNNGDYFTVVEGTLQEVINEAVASSTIILTEDLTLSAGVLVTKELTLDLSNYTISTPTITELAAIEVNNGGRLTINATENGGINSASQNNDCSIAVWARAGGYVVINGGTYTNLGAISADKTTGAPYNNEMIYTSGNGSEIIINDGRFIGNYENETWGTRYTVNKHDSTNSTITVNGGSFYKYNPAESLSENPIANFVAEGKMVVSDGVDYIVVSADEFVNYVAKTEIVYISLNKDIILNDGIVITRELTLDLNDYTISTPEIDELAAIEVNNGGRLTINATENGGINSASQNNDCSIAVWARAGGYAVINGGTYTNVGAISADPTTGAPYNNEMIYTSGDGSEIVINGGKFIGNYENKTWETRYTVNKHDSTNSTITINGGSFYKYNPAESRSENPVANFVAEGYKVVIEGDYYTVVAE